ncbi:PD-(D/E)XK nuclease family protein [Psychrobacter sp. ANT_H56B]|uniref:PDDEXK-like family protein n=1 Tax=Psychrobacter sp. ANT_H56B TaxID=2597353 RepID=UPI00165E28C8|nr:PD-(D/E)XK nuclease family protein [Psychrobacter sp. ANT_H56B]
MSEVQTLINEVSQKIQALETAQALYSRQLSPDFNTFDYINTDELGLSRILAALLDPKGSHAQQETFLRLFVEHCLPDMYKTSERQVFLNNLEKTDVFLEEITVKSNTQRRMDIYLQCQVGDDSYGICIENKPYAADQFEQLKDYAEELEKRSHKAWHLVYLNESDEGPSKYSIDTSKLEALKNERQYSHLRFSGLVGWLKACQVECQNHSVSEFIAQLINFIQKQFMGIEDMNEAQSVLNTMLSSQENIASALKIALSAHEMKKQLIEKLQRDLITIIEEKSKPYSMIKTDLKGVNREEQITFNIKKSALDLCLGFGGTVFNYPYLGIFIANKDATPDYEYYEKILSKCKSSDSIASENIKAEEDKSKDGYWCAWYSFEPHDWWSKTEPWEQIHNGEMANKIIEQLDGYYKVLNDNNLLNK